MGYYDSPHYHRQLKKIRKIKERTCLCANSYCAEGKGGIRKRFNGRAGQKYCCMKCRNSARSRRQYVRKKMSSNLKMGKHKPQDALVTLPSIRSIVTQLTSGNLSKVNEELIKRLGWEKPPKPEELLSALIGIHLKRLSSFLDKESKATKISKEVTQALKELRLTINDVKVYGGESGKGPVIDARTLIINATKDFDPARAEYIEALVEQTPSDRDDDEVGGETP